METARLLYQACEAGEGIIGHRGIRFVCLSVVCRLSVVCLSSNSSQPMGPIITKMCTQVLKAIARVSQDWILTAVQSPAPQKVTPQN